MRDHPPGDGWVECAGAFIPADVIRFSETVWRRGKHAGERTWLALVLDVEGPGEAHWVYLEAISAEGDFPEPAGHQFRRKRRNVEHMGTVRRLWSDERARDLVASGRS